MLIEPIVYYFWYTYKHGLDRRIKLTWILCLAWEDVFFLELGVLFFSTENYDQIN